MKKITIYFVISLFLSLGLEIKIGERPVLFRFQNQGAFIPNTTNSASFFQKFDEVV